MKNGTAARTAKDKDPGDRQDKQIARLTAARARTELKVARLRERLTRAERKLAKRTARLDAAGAGTTPEIPSVAEAAAEPVTASVAPPDVPYEGERETAVAPAVTRRSSRPRAKTATAPIPAVKTRKAHRNSHRALPASASVTDDGRGGAK